MVRLATNPCPFSEPSPSLTHWPLTTECPPSPCQAYPYLLTQGGGGECSRQDWQKMRKNAAKNAIENAILLEWCLPLKTPMFRLVLHNRALKAWTV